MTLSDVFLRSAMIFAIVGMGLGIHMAGQHDFTLAPAHAHINLVGWVGLFIAGLFYRLVPQAEGGLARLHLALALSGAVLLPLGIAAIVLGHPGMEALAIVGSLLTIAGVIVFTINVFRWTGAKHRG